MKDILTAGRISKSGRGAMMRASERPVLTAAGSFDKVTGLSIFGPRETLVQYQLF
jgi:hypothetical protein